jgi:3-phenylpropionate/trans-cinnamate dioxygenase ferredoxin subunit
MTEGWTEVARIGEILPGRCKAVVIDDRMIAIVNLDGEFYAIDNVCTHAFAILSEGKIEGDQIQCPLHAARFNIRTGEVTAPPAYEPLQTYEVRVENDAIFVKTP